MERREFLRKLLMGAAGFAALQGSSPSGSKAAGPTNELGMPVRPLGNTGFQAGLFSLGGEGVLRTTGYPKEASAVIDKALDMGVNYCDTAPAYQQSQDYYGATLGKRRDKIFLASKTHDRTKEGSLRLLENSLERLRTDRLDLWQLHDLRTQDDLAAIFAPGGAIEAVEQAKKDGKIRFAGITGHYDPQILLSAMRQYPFDSVMIPVNAADKARLSFIYTVLPEAKKRGMAVIGMKVLEHGELFGGLLTPEQAINYALSHAVSTVIIGCSSPREVTRNAATAKSFQPLDPSQIAEIEAKLSFRASSFNPFKKTGDSWPQA